VAKDLTKRVPGSSSRGLRATVSDALGFQGLATGLLCGVSTMQQRSSKE